MSAPRTKRQFAGAASDPAQRRITSFFSSNGSSSPTSDAAAASSTSPSEGGLAAAEPTVQANLLSVGMRVRKAVPEGYKTGDHYSAFSLWSDTNNSTPAKTSSSTTRKGPAYDATGRSRPAAAASSAPAPRELLPFCGIHKIGGLGTQGSTLSSSSSEWEPTRHPSSIDGGMYDDDDNVPGLTLSQESVDSNYDDRDAAAKTRKRFFADDADEDAHAEAGFLDDEISPRSLGPADLANSRVFAMPRKGRLQQGKMTSSGQENVMVVDGDFEEAAFLDPNNEVEMNDA